jgi:hypothetical protein
MSTTKQQSQYVPTEGIINSALNTAKQVAKTIGVNTQQVTHTLGEKIGWISDQKEFATFVDPLANPKDLELVKSQLKHVQTCDKSKPVIDKNVHIKKNQHKALFAEIPRRHNLKHTSISHNASKPFLDKDIHIKESPQKKLFVDIREHHYQLKHVITKDRSVPVIPKDVHIEKSVTKKLNEKLAQVSHTIGEKTEQAVQTLGEKTQQVAHKFEEKIGYKFTPGEPKDEFVKFFDLLANPKDLELVKSHLKQVQTCDKSKPVFDKNIHIKMNQHKALFSEIPQRHTLKHVSISHDASKPFLDKDMHIKEAPQKKIIR